MNKINWIVGLILIFISSVSCSQSKQEKTEFIINKLNLIETQKTSFKFQVDALKYRATRKDRIRIIDLEKLVSDDEIVKRIRETFSEVLSDKEVNDIYNSLQLSASDMLFNTRELFKAISTQFSDINKELEDITRNVKEKVENPTSKSEPTPIDKENGFYATVGYNYSTENKDIKLEANPSLTSIDILELKKTYSNYYDSYEISILFTKEGTKKFQILTKESIGKPIIIVIAKHIVSMPTVISEIIDGKAIISGDFSEEKIDKMIEILKNK
ncbi:MAG: hypothetical protein JKY08_07280 [Flavobacteriaceae bacterium]|nr:hypothetical protein [Flavobacteriaceae bacterium]